MFWDFMIDVLNRLLYALRISVIIQSPNIIIQCEKTPLSFVVFSYSVILY